VDDFESQLITSAPESLVQDNPSEAINEHSLSGVRILIVEDSWHVALAMRTLAENFGMLVAGPAATVAEAEALLLSHTPDVAVVDIHLRDEMAYGVIDRLHAEGVPIVVTSGYEVLPFGNSQVEAILTKPFRATDLLAHLRRIIARRTAS
jgi:DNA-binding response OmpR family regulator